MTDTKEQILITALHLFARDGYEAVAVSAIAGELGITKGALYRHYKNKRDIFDSIVERMYQTDAERSREYNMPVDTYEQQPGQYENMSLASIERFTVEQFRFWTEDDFASHLRKMLALEQYRSAEMAELYHGCITSGPVAYMEDVFRELMKKGVLRKDDARQLAFEFYAPFLLLLNMYDATGEGDNLTEILKKHIGRFFRCHVAEPGEGKETYEKRN